GEAETTLQDATQNVEQVEAPVTPAPTTVTPAADCQSNF
ncbi:hypothetical protein PR003_g28238, partial [Phytophthora rubi]